MARPGKYWLSTVHAGDPADSVDATAVLTMLDRHATDPHETPIRTAAVELAPGTPWVRRCNLLDTTTVFLQIYPEPG